jgi:choline dehydrogenase-like flavoprotein
MKAYDYVIVGAGSAGCVLANRLSTNPDVRVLLLEAGGGDAHPYIRVPIGLGMMWKHRMFDWRYDSVPESGLHDRRLVHLRGKVLGGSSSVNVMAFTRGHPGDYDRWAQNGAPGWSWSEVLPYFKRVETWEGGESVVRGGSGPVGVQFARTKDPLFEALLASGIAAGFPTTDDYNGANPLGFGRSQYSIRDGRRSSAARAYLQPVRSRPNLTVETAALVHRVVLDGTRACGVDYERRGALERIRAEREVLVCGGTFNTPQILMLSGIGPADHLRSVGVTPVVDLPVGNNLQDHLSVQQLWKRREPGHLYHQLRYDRIGPSMARAYLFGSGPATVVPGGLHAFLKTDDALPVPDIEFMFRAASADAHPWFPMVQPPYQDTYYIGSAILHPKSRGEVRLQSADPRKPVLINNRFLSHPDDLPTLRQAYVHAREVGRQAPLDPYRGEPITPGPEVRSEREIDEWIRRIASTVSHPAGTCPMGSDERAVLDPQLRVRGVDGLRVVDASAMPDLVSAHINACVLMMAEKAADLIGLGAR